MLKNGSIAGITAGLLGQSSAKGVAKRGSSPSDFGVEFLSGFDKWRLVRRAVRTDEFSKVQQYLNSDGWTVSFESVRAFSVSRESEYQGVIIGMKNRAGSVAETTEAHYVHLFGDLPGNVERTSYGHIGKLTGEVSIAGRDLQSVEETFVTPKQGSEITSESESGQVSIETETVDPEEFRESLPSSETKGEYETTGNGCEICYRDCTISFECALTITVTGIGIIGCAAGILLSGGLLALLCLVPVGWGLYQSYSCINDKDCNWYRDTVTRGEFRDLDNPEDVTYEEYCDAYSCN